MIHTAAGQAVAKTFAHNVIMATKELQKRRRKTVTVNLFFAAKFAVTHAQGHGHIMFVRNTGCSYVCKT